MMIVYGRSNISIALIAEAYAHNLFTGGRGGFNLFAVVAVDIDNGNIRLGEQPQFGLKIILKIRMFDGRNMIRTDV